MSEKDLSQLTLFVEVIPAPHIPGQAQYGEQDIPISPDISLPWLDDCVHNGWSARMFLHQLLIRENVPSPTIDHFDAGLAALGYGTVIVRVDAAKITGQSRQRDFTVGCYQVSRQNTASIFSDCENGSGSYTTRLGTRQIAPALTTHRTRYDSRDCYIYEGERLRILDSDERETLAGFPSGWTAGFSEATRARMCGNAVVPQVAEWIGKRITAVEVL